MNYKSILLVFLAIAMLSQNTFTSNKAISQKPINQNLEINAIENEFFNLYHRNGAAADSFMLLTTGAMCAGTLYKKKLQNIYKFHNKSTNDKATFAYQDHIYNFANIWQSTNNKLLKAFALGIALETGSSYYRNNQYSDNHKLTAKHKHSNENMPKNTARVERIRQNFINDMAMGPLLKKQQLGLTINNTDAKNISDSERYRSIQQTIIAKLPLGSVLNACQNILDGYGANLANEQLRTNLSISKHQRSNIVTPSCPCNNGITIVESTTGRDCSTNHAPRGYFYPVNHILHNLKKQQLSINEKNSVT